MTGRRPTGGEHGFSLPELLVVVVILGVIGFALSQTVIFGLRTTASTAASSSRSTATQALASYFTDDAQSAETAAGADGSCVTGPVLVHLAWTELGVPKAVSYGLDPPAGDEQDLVRWSCAGGGPPARRVLGRFTRDVVAGTGPPVSVSCDGAACPATASSPTTMTVRVVGDPPVELTIRRRTAS